MIKDVCVIGGGVAGMTASIYLSRAGFKPTIFMDYQIGGNISYATVVENYPGFKEISGSELSTSVYQQMLDYDVQINDNKVVEVKQQGDYFIVKDDMQCQYTFKSVIVATGTQPRKLNLDNFSELIGKGVSFCAMCDGSFCKEKDVVVVGGGNTAITTAIYLSNIANKVIVCNRSQKFRADVKVLNKAYNIQNIQILTNTQINKLFKNDNGVLKSVLLNNGQSINVSMLFCCIGAIPKTEIINFINKDKQGYIMIYNNSSKTSCNGIFACGDCANPNYKQVIVAAGTGAMAAIDCIKHLNN